MLEQPDGTVPKVLTEAGVDTIRLAEAVKKSIERMPKVSGGGAGARRRSTRRRRPSAYWASCAGRSAERMQDTYVATEHILLAIIEEGASAGARTLRDFGITKEKVEQALSAVRGSSHITDPGAEGQYQTLAKYSRDLTQAARERASSTR